MKTNLTHCLCCMTVTATLFASHSSAADKQPTALLRAHAHNDYLHDRPLLDALDNGFCSVEADIFLVKDKLLVAHTRSELSEENSLEQLYLEPLRKRIKQNGGRVYPDGPAFTLLIDIKSDGEATYRALHHVLLQYHDIFSRVENGHVHQKAVTAIVSGNRPHAAIAGDSPRYVGIDGRLSDLDSDQPAPLMPLISDNWRNHFKWRGDGDLPEAERMKLLHIVQQAHTKNRRVRFWATPDNPAVWKTLDDAAVDLINTDNLPGLSEFLRMTP
ncbi:MAG: phosphatidylinositol-specific phospholipase C/glycerophosphodiester phosphodiesterase family protein [Fuerstiella sp.]